MSRRGTGTQPLARAALAAAAILAVASCSAGPPLPEDHFYRLEIAAPAARAAPLLSGTIEVERLAADGVLGGRPLVRTGDGAELMTYHYHYWVEPPPILLQTGLVAYLRNARAARTVVTPELRIEPEFEITGRILAFEQDTKNGRAVVELELGLKEVGDDRLIHLGTYREEEAAASTSVTAAVRAMGAATARIFQRFLADAARAAGEG